MPPSPPDHHTADQRAWSTASVLSGHTGSRRAADRQSSQPQPAAHQQFERRLSSKKELAGGMTKRWLDEDQAKQGRKELSRALAVLKTLSG